MQRIVHPAEHVGDQYTWAVRGGTVACTVAPTVPVNRTWSCLVSLEPHRDGKDETGDESLMGQNRNRSLLFEETTQTNDRYVNVATADVRRARGDAGWVAPIRCESDQ